MSELRLRPTQGSRAPELLVQAGELIVRRTGHDDVAVPIRPDQAYALARYWLRDDLSAMLGFDPVSRVGWRVVDAHGTCLMWLAHDVYDVYDLAQAHEFAVAAGLVPVDHGAVPLSRIVTSGGQRVGPGTSVVGNFVAPLRSFGFAGLLLSGGAMGLLPGTVSGWDWPWLVSAVWFVASMLGTFVTGWLLGMSWYAWRSKKFFDAASFPLLRPRNRAAGAVITMIDGEVVAYDSGREYRGKGTARLELLPTSNRWAPGLLVRWDGAEAESTYVLYRADFHGEEVYGFASRCGIELIRADDHAVPPQPAFDSVAGLWLARKLTAMARVMPVVVVVAVVAGAAVLAREVGWVSFPRPYSYLLTWFALTTGGGMAILSNQRSDALVRPESLVPRSPLG